MDNRNWMYMRRDTIEYLRGVEEFLQFAKNDMISKGLQSICCPCRDCQNLRRFQNIGDIKYHLIRRGFKNFYTEWIWHGESVGSTSANPQVSNDPENLNMDSNDNHDGANDTDNNYDNLDETINDIDENFDEFPDIFETFFNESNVPLFPGCTNFTKMSATFKLYNLKAKNGWSDKSFTSLLQLLITMLPEHNELPNSTYRAKKMLCPLSMSVEKINACPNDCIIYRGEFRDMENCPKCNASRYIQKNKDKNGPPAKVFWYLSIIPRFQRLFANPKDAKLLRWHHDCRKDDGMLRHPADSPDWRNIDRLWSDFGNEPRNLRLGLCTDGMNPYSNMSSRHSTWPVLLCVYNLPPWLCMKRRYLMMPLLISGPKQPGNDIDVYLAPLFDDLDKLWREGLRVYDACKKEYFDLRAMIFCTINDFPAYSNLSGFKNKGAKACPVCAEETSSIRLANCKKSVYMGHRRFLRRAHPYRRKKDLFDGTIELRNAPMALSGVEVYNQVKDINIEFGKKIRKHDFRVMEKKVNILEPSVLA